MKNEKNLLNQFEDLAPIEPSDEWSKKVMQKMEDPKKGSERKFGHVLLLGSIVILLCINVFSYTLSLKHEKKQDNFCKYQNVANEFFVTSSSSKY